MRRFTLAAVTVAAVLTASAPVSAALLTFDDLAGSQGSNVMFLPAPFAYDDFTFSPMSTPLFLIPNLPCPNGGCVSDGTAYLESADPGLDGSIRIVMAAANTGSTFTLVSFASALGFVNTANSTTSPDQVSVTGQKVSGGTVQASFNLSTAFSTNVLSSGFTGLTSVMFQGVFQPNETFMQIGFNSLALDNILVADGPTPPSNVPEPASAWALVVGLLGPAWRRVSPRTMAELRGS